MKVLIIDDEIDLSLLLKTYFVRKGYEAVIAHTLSNGLAILSEFNPDILFLDNNLPDGIGWKEAPSIAEDHPALQLFLISAYHPVVPEMPADSNFIVLEKPISFSDLDKKISSSSSSSSALAESPETENI